MTQPWKAWLSRHSANCSKNPYSFPRSLLNTPHDVVTSITSVVSNSVGFNPNVRLIWLIWEFRLKNQRVFLSIFTLASKKRSIKKIRALYTTNLFFLSFLDFIWRNFFGGFSREGFLGGFFRVYFWDKCEWKTNLFSKLWQKSLKKFRWFFGHHLRHSKRQMKKKRIAAGVYPFV